MYNLFKKTKSKKYDKMNSINEFTYEIKTKLSSMSFYSLMPLYWQGYISFKHLFLTVSIVN